MSPLSAVMIASRFLLYYYSVEILFNVPNHFGKPNAAVVNDIADIFQLGMLPPVTGASSGDPTIRMPRERPRA